MLFFPKINVNVRYWKKGLSCGIVWVCLARWDQWNRDIDWCHHTNCFRNLVAATHLKMVSNVLEGAMKVGGIIGPCIVKDVMLNA